MTKAERKRWEFNLIKTGNISTGNIASNAISRNARGLRATQQRNVRSDVVVMNQNSVGPGDRIEQMQELVQVVNGSFLFKSVALDIQPGNPLMFPWLASIAQKYTKYNFKRLRFEYRPTVSQYAAAGQTGRVVLAVNYDAYEGNLTALKDAETLDPHTAAMPYQSADLQIAADVANQGGRYVRGTFLPPGADQKTYDAGVLYIATEGGIDNQPIGELYVVYEIHLTAPVLYSALAQVPRNTTLFQAYNTGVIGLTSGVNFLGTWAVVLHNNVGAIINGSNISLPIGYYMLFASILFDCVPPAGITLATCKVLLNAAPLGDIAASQQVISIGSISDTNLQAQTLVRITSATDVLTVQGNAAWAGGGSVAANTSLIAIAF